MTNRVLNPDSAALLIIDIQEAFRKSITSLDSVIARTVAVARGFEILDMPVVITEQYPKGLGKTVSEISNELADAVYFEKSKFSACGANGFDGYLKDRDIDQIVVAGIETHVCVNQTVHGLLAEGYSVHLLEDAVASRSPRDHETAIRKMTSSGAVPATVEMALFELLVDSGSPKFKEIQLLIK